MTGPEPSRRNPFRRKGKQRRAEEQAVQGGHGPVEGAQAPAEPTAALPAEYAAERPDQAPGTVSAMDTRDERGRAASLAAAAGRAAGRGMSRSGRSARQALAVVADRIIETAPRIPVRDLTVLRSQFPGLGPEELADKLVAGAANGSAAVGASVGAAAMMPVPPAMPAELAAEVVGVASVELKLIAELHEVYGIRPQGNLTRRTSAYLTSWTEERGIDVTRPTSVNAALGSQMKRELRQQILKRTVRNLPNLMPFMVGAAVGATMNRRDTKKLAEKIRKDLRERQIPWDALPPAAGPEPEPGSPKALQQAERPAEGPGKRGPG